MQTPDVLSDEIIYGTASGVKQMLESGAEVNGLDGYGYTPLIQSAIVNNLEMAVALISYGANANDRDLVGRSALHWASENNNFDLCKLLLDHRADANAYSKMSQPVLVTPLLRNFPEIKNLLYNHGAHLKFAQDFINAKLIAHRFELEGQIDIVTHKDQFIEIDLEGFFLEFTLGIIQQSLQLYKRNFAARHLRSYFDNVQKMVDALENAAHLIKYQQYTVDINQHQRTIDMLLNQQLLVIPVGYEGHAITFVKYGDLLARCDRGEEGRLNGCVVIYRIHNLAAFNEHFVKDLMFSRQTKNSITVDIKRKLNLELIDQLPLSPQNTGNCSWANVEAVVPTMLYFLLLHDHKHGQTDIITCRDSAMYFYKEWLEWDRDRALYDCIQSFKEASEARRASKAVLLGSVLFQRCKYPLPKDLERAEKILDILSLPEYRYIIESYIKVFHKKERTKEGENLLKLLEYFDVNYYQSGIVSL
jgi:hypothetical protein